MLKLGTGVIVNCSPVAGLIGLADLPPYAAFKHGVTGLTKTAALKYAELEIQVNAVCPQVIKTPMIDRIMGNKKKVEDQFTGLEPIG